ncbi:MAG: alpha/beta hydrolase family protein [Pseudonocardiaceae bacterium]
MTACRLGSRILHEEDARYSGNRSGGDLATATYDELVGDALAGVAYLKARAEVDPARIGLFGHSEGGYLAPLTAQESDDVAFVILMSGPAVPGEDVLVLQNRLLFQAAGAPPEQIETQVEYVREMVGLLRAEDYQAAETLARGANPTLDAIVRHLRPRPGPRRTRRPGPGLLRRKGPAGATHPERAGAAKTARPIIPTSPSARSPSSTT